MMAFVVEIVIVCDECETKHLQRNCVLKCKGPGVGYAGASPGFGRGGSRIFFSDLEICMSRSYMLRMAKPCALLGLFGGMLPREKILKWCNLVRFGVYFDQILSLKNFNNYHFFYIKNL